MKRKKRKLLRVILVVAVLLVLAICATGGVFRWSEIELRKELPRPSSMIGEVITNTEESLSMEAKWISPRSYRAYVEKCEGFGYVIDSDKSDSSFSAYNEDGYKIDLSYFKSVKTLHISLDAPIEATAFQWPRSEIAKLIPEPKSMLGKIEWEGDHGFLLYVIDTPLEDYQEYVDACMDRGFVVDYDKGETNYYADNQNGYHLSLSYEGNNTMRIRLDEPEDRTEEETTSSTEAPVETPEQPEESSPSNLVDGMRPEFKEAMDSYEAFFDEYCDFMEAYNTSGNTAGMLDEYAKFLSQYTDTMEKFDAWEEDLNDTELTYYIQVQNRINQKLLAAAG